MLTFTDIKERITNLDWLTALIIVIAVCGLLSAYHATFYASQLVSPEVAKMLIGNRSIDTILDVRSAEEYATGHYPGAVNVEYTNIERDAPKVIPNKNATVLVYCRTAHRAKIAVKALNKMGFKNVVFVSSTYKSLI